MGTVWINRNVITPASPTDFRLIRYKGVQSRFTYDRRIPGWTTRPSHIFEALYACARPVVEVVVNNEFSKRRAATEARKYARIVGQLPPGLRRNVKQIWIHKGNRPAGGGNESILVHTGRAERYWPYVEEIFLHEAAHTSLDYAWDGTVDQEEWSEAMELDGRSISTYAADHPEREDIAESYGAYALWSVLSRRNEDPATAKLIQSTIPNRLAYLLSLGPDFVPSTRSCPVYGSPITPSTVTNFRAKVSDRGVLVSWQPPKSWGAGTLRQFEYRTGRQPWTSTTTPSVRLETPARGTIRVQVRALNEAGRGPVSRLKLDLVR
jgi:hypothetical protein